MTICRLVRRQLAWCWTRSSLVTGYEKCTYIYISSVLLVVLCHTTFEHIGLFVWRVETPLRLSLSSVNDLPPSAMSTNISSMCSQCNKYRLPVEYGTHQRGNRKGDRLSRCLSCSATNTANRKRRCIESNAGHPAMWVAAPHPMSSSDSVAALAKHTSAAQIDDHWCVSVDEMTLPDKDVANHLMSLAWNATGYRFR